MSSATSSHQLLEQQLTQLHSLEVLLLKEREVLQQHSPDALLAVTAEKKALLAQIEEFDRSIGSNLQFIDDKKQGLLDEALSQVTEALEKCQEINLVNGQVIQHSQLAVERMKNSLLDSQSRSSVTYDSKGKTHAGLSSLGIKA